MDQYKVIFHVDEMDKWKLVLANVRNLLDALEGNELSIEILANSEAVKYLIVSSQTNESSHTLRELAKDKVDFVVCNNSLKTYDIDPSVLFPFSSIVPSGVAELTLKQKVGFAYIKP